MKIKFASSPRSPKSDKECFIKHIPVTVEGNKLTLDREYSWLSIETTTDWQRENWRWLNTVDINRIVILLPRNLENKVEKMKYIHVQNSLYIQWAILI